MITPPDFKEKQILFLSATELGEYDLSFRNENILIQKEERTYEKVPLHKLLAVFIEGEMTFTSKLVQKCARNSTSLFLLKRNLETYATIGAYAEGNYLLRQKQYILSDRRKLLIAKKIVENKLMNHLALIRSTDTSQIAGKELLHYKRLLKGKIDHAESLASLRGLEGTMSKDFFGSYFATINWYKRIPRGKIDENNILLDIGYSFLFNFMDSLLRVYGFDTYKGVYHQLFFQRKSLSCDVMEPFRCVVERALVKMHNLGQFDPSDFTHRNGKYYLSYKHNAKYTGIFLQEIMHNKIEMHEYVRSLYYHILNDAEDLPEYLIR